MTILKLIILLLIISSCGTEEKRVVGDQATSESGGKSVGGAKTSNQTQSLSQFETGSIPVKVNTTVKVRANGNKFWEMERVKCHNSGMYIMDYQGYPKPFFYSSSGGISWIDNDYNNCSDELAGTTMGGIGSSSPAVLCKKDHVKGEFDCGYLWTLTITGDWYKNIEYRVFVEESYVGPKIIKMPKYQPNY